MGPSTVSVQLLPVQLERMTVGQLSARFWADVLERHDIQVRLSAVRLLQARRPVQERRKLAHLERQEFVVAFGARAGCVGGRRTGDGATPHPYPVPARCDRRPRLTSPATGLAALGLPLPSRFLASSRRSFAPRDGRVGRRGRCTWVSRMRTLRRRSSAVLRFWAWLRRSVAVTVTPVGAWTSRTAEAVLFRCWPPGPPPTKVVTSHARSSASSSRASAARAASRRRVWSDGCILRQVYNDRRAFARGPRRAPVSFTCIRATRL